MSDLEIEMASDEPLRRTPALQILLATYNGAAFLQEQLDSLFGQTEQDFEILVADDGSSDRTLEILEAAVAQRRSQIRIVYRDRVGGAARNFMRLLELTDAPYVMFCDQDDVWLPHKVERMLARLRMLEVDDPSTPRLLHTDLVVVDRQLKVISDSLFHYQGLKPEKTSVNDLVLRNSVTGCASILNRPLAAMLRCDNPDDMFMHDWWVALVAAACGQVHCLEECTTLYRQHNHNSLGAVREEAATTYFAKRLWNVLFGGPLKRPMRRTVAQAAAFELHYGQTLRGLDRDTVERLSRLGRQGAVAKRFSAIRHGLLRQGALRNLVTLITM